MPMISFGIKFFKNWPQPGALSFQMENPYSATNTRNKICDTSSSVTQYMYWLMGPDWCSDSLTQHVFYSCQRANFQYLNIQFHGCSMNNISWLWQLINPRLGDPVLQDRLSWLRCLSGRTKRQQGKTGNAIVFLPNPLQHPSSPH